MSIDCLRWGWTVPDLSPTAKLVLLRLCDRANDFPHCYAWPTVKGIAADTGCSRATVLRALQALRDRGLIVPVGYGGKTGQAVVYAVMGRWSQKRAGWMQRHPEGEARWSHCDTPVGSQRDPGGITVIPGGPHGETRNPQTTHRQAPATEPARPSGKRAGSSRGETFFDRER